MQKAVVIKSITAALLCNCKLRLLSLSLSSLFLSFSLSSGLAGFGLGGLLAGSFLSLLGSLSIRLGGLLGALGSRLIFSLNRLSSFGGFLSGLGLGSILGGFSGFLFNSFSRLFLYGLGGFLNSGSCLLVIASAAGS